MCYVLCAIPNSSGNGGQIKNSYLITDTEDIKAYASYLMFESEYSSYFSGSIEGFIYEWEVHNLAYQVFSELGDTKRATAAKSVDIGRTIYDDNHGILTDIMLRMYEMKYPVQAKEDLETYKSLGK